MNAVEQTEILRKSLQWLMLLRAGIATFLLGATAYIQSQETYLYLYPSLCYIYTFIGIVYGLTIIYGFLLPRFRNLRSVAYFQISGDVVFVTILIYLTGGAESIFSFVYLLPIISASIVLYRRGGLIIASLSTILFGALLDLEYYNVLIPLGKKGIEYIAHDVHYFFYILTMNTGMFFLVAMLSSNIAHRLEKTESELEKKKVDYSKLEALYSDIVENVNSGLISLDKDGRILFLNKAGEKVLAHRLSDIHKRPINEVFPWVDLKCIDQMRGEALWKRGDGQDVFLGYSISPSRDTEGRIMVFQDITNIKELEEQIVRSERLAAIGEMAAGVAHEIRNPIASISGSVEMLKEELIGSDQTHPLMNIILRETDRLNRFVSDFLQFTKPVVPQRKFFLLKDLVEDVLLSMNISPGWNRGIEVRMNIPPSISVYADSEQLRQVLLNLFLNAIQAMPDCGTLFISATVRSRRSEERDGKWKLEHGKSNGGDYIEISVCDTGIGVTPENLKKVFNPFFTTKDNGTGLGLSIVHQIVENHHGEIRVKSQQDHGTTVIMRLPHRDKNLSIHDKNCHE